MACKTLQVRTAGLNAVIAFVLRPDRKMHPSCNRGVNGGFDGFERIFRHMFDHALREKSPFAAIKKRPDALSRATCRLGDGFHCQRPCGTGIGSMMAKGSEKSPCGVMCLQNVHW